MHLHVRLYIVEGLGTRLLYSWLGNSDTDSTNPLLPTPVGLKTSTSSANEQVETDQTFDASGKVSLLLPRTTCQHGQVKEFDTSGNPVHQRRNHLEISSKINRNHLEIKSIISVGAKVQQRQLRHQVSAWPRSSITDSKTLYSLCIHRHCRGHDIDTS